MFAAFIVLLACVGVGLFIGAVILFYAAIVGFFGFLIGAFVGALVYAFHLFA
jgi:hypothetical protein